MLENFLENEVVSMKLLQITMSVLSIKSREHSILIIFNKKNVSMKWPFEMHCSEHFKLTDNILLKLICSRKALWLRQNGILCAKKLPANNTHPIGSLEVTVIAL